MRLLRKTCAVCMALLLLFSGFACDGLFPGNWMKLASKRMNSILTCLEQDDVQGLKKMFSKKATAEAEKLDETLALMVDVFQGDVVTEVTEDTAFPSEVREIEKGLTRQEITLYMEIETTEDAYVFFFVDYPWDELTPENEGLYTLRMIRKADEEREMGMSDVMTFAGAYVPGCGLQPYIDTDRSLAQERTDVIIPILRAEDEESLKGLFAKSVQENVKEDISAMFAELELTDEMNLDCSYYAWNNSWVPEDTLLWQITATIYKEETEEYVEIYNFFFLAKLQGDSPEKVGIIGMKLLFGSQELYVDYFENLSTPGVYIEK